MMIRISFRKLLLCLATLGGCAAENAADPAVGDISQAGVATFECIDICAGPSPGAPCRHICAYHPATPDELGGMTSNPGSKCDERRQINICGDGCCDSGEIFEFPKLPSCLQDCRIDKIDVAKLEDRAVHLLSEGRSVARFVDDDLVVDLSCAAR